MKEVKKINEIIDSIDKNIILSDSVDEKQKLLMMEILYLLLSDKEFSKHIQENL